MRPALPAPELVKAIRTFVRLAYPNGQPPTNRRHFAELRDDVALGDLLGLNGVQPLPGSQEAGVSQLAGYSFRIGNSSYPHMKLMVRSIEAAPGFVLAVDTHDEFGNLPLPPSEKQAVEQLRQHNRDVAHSINAAWEAQGLPTQRSILREFLHGEGARTMTARRILVVDDEAEVAELIEAVLASHGFEVRVALTGGDALEQAKVWHPHGLVLDLMLPDLSGWDVARRLRTEADFHGVSILMLTAYVGSDAREAASALGIGAFMNKPFDPRVLIRELERLLEAGAAG